MNPLEPIKVETKIQREGLTTYRVYKKVAGTWKLKKTFYTRHQARRYEKGMHKPKLEGAR